MSHNFNKYTKNNLNYYLTIFFDNKLTYITKNSLKNIFFNLIKYTQIYKKKSKYNILYIKLNPILKKITVNNYKKLIIPEKILVKYFYKQIGLPINYLKIKRSVKKINAWYELRGFNWTEIEYFYNSSGNEINITIREGKINQVICKNKNRFNWINNLNNLYFNKCITKEFLSIHSKILNINDLNFNITKIKKKYLIDTLKYNLKYNHSGLILIIEYKLKDKNRELLQYHNQILIQNFRINIKLFKSYIKNTIDDNQFKLITKIYTYLKINFKLSIIEIYKKYDINEFTFNNLINTIIHNFYNHKLNYFSNIINISTKIFFYSKYTYAILNNYFPSNFQYLKLIAIDPYLYSITLVKIKIKFQLQYFKNMENKQNFLIIYNFNNKKNCLIYNYIKYIKFFNLKKIIKLYSKTLINYKIKLKYNYYLILFNKALIINNRLTLSYNKFIYIKINELHLFNLIKNYICLIKLKYYNLFEIPNFFHMNQNFTIFLKINKLIGPLSKYFILSHIFLQKNKNILLNLEYKLSIIKYHYIYLHLNYIPNIKSTINYIPKCYINSKYSNIEFAIGIQLKIPIKYIENIRLELQIKNNIKFFIYFYKNSLFYR